MSKPEFTPGIWRVAGYVDEDERDGAVAVVAHDGFIVADVLKWPQQDANARLIAAAPDMYEALKAGTEMRRAQSVYFKDRSRENLIASKEAEKRFDRLAEAAIAKAEGRAA